MFRFNFSAQVENKKAEEEDTMPETNRSRIVTHAVLHDATNVSASLPAPDQRRELQFSGWSFTCVVPPAIDKLENTDLIENVYEGGYKIWECSADLIQYIAQSGTPMVEHRLVADLGCGGGLLGLLALKCGATQVLFQDYNHEVIRDFTLPNVRLNLTDADERAKSACTFVSGDWDSVSTLIEESGLGATFDTVLTSETIYNPSAYPSLHHALSTCLKRGGIALVAAKDVYFGNGGSIAAWVEFTNKCGLFQTEAVKRHRTGLCRTILRMEKL